MTAVAMPEYRTLWAHPDRHRARRATEGPPHVIVIHTSEQPTNAKGTAAGLARFIAGPASGGNVASYAWEVDVAEIWHTVRVADLDGRDDIAFHAPPNDRGESICLTGRAGRDWRDPVNLPQLELAARLTAARCAARGFPPIKLMPTAVAAGVKGICGHADISTAFGKTNHWDPGPEFPWYTFTSRVQSLLTEPEDADMQKLIVAPGKPKMIIMVGAGGVTGYGGFTDADFAWFCRELGISSTPEPVSVAVYDDLYHKALRHMGYEPRA